MAALFYSLIESAKLAGVEPRARLGDAIRRAIRYPGAVTLARDPMWLESLGCCTKAPDGGKMARTYGSKGVEGNDETDDLARDPTDGGRLRLRATGRRPVPRS